MAPLGISKRRQKDIVVAYFAQIHSHRSPVIQLLSDDYEFVPYDCVFLDKQLEFVQFVDPDRELGHGWGIEHDVIRGLSSNRKHIRQQNLSRDDD